jgi:hypothetical protein
VFSIRIRIFSYQIPGYESGIEIRIQEGKNDPFKLNTS